MVVVGGSMQYRQSARPSYRVTTASYRHDGRHPVVERTDGHAVAGERQAPRPNRHTRRARVTALTTPAVARISGWTRRPRNGDPSIATEATCSGARTATTLTKNTADCGRPDGQGD